MRRAAKRDSNEREIIACAKALGMSVVQLSDPDIPDLLLGIKGKNYLAEVKTPTGQLRPGQVQFKQTWKGQTGVIRSVDDLKNLIERNEMVSWDYLEAQCHIDKDQPARFFVLAPYAELYKLDITKPYTLTELGNKGWNIALSVTDIINGHTNVVFKHPKE